MADQIEPMAPGRFLELLNKSNRSMQEENDLQAELRRQEAEKAAQAGTGTPVAETVANQPIETPAQTEVPAEQPTNPVQPENVAPEAPQEAQPTQEVEVATSYDLNQLTDETNTAIAYLDTQNKTLAVEMAKSAFTQAAYWTKLASEGK